MREIFHGWRRRIGLATLVMALAFTAAWGRSLIIINRLTFQTGIHDYSRLASIKGSIVWLRVFRAEAARLPAPNEHSAELFHELMNSMAEWLLCGILLDDAAFQWNRPLLGIETWKHTQQNSWGAVQAYALKISYWWIILPLTLCSAYFLLAHPRRSTLKKDNETGGGGAGSM